MDFLQAFLNAIVPNKVLAKTFSIEDYLPSALWVPKDISENLPHIQAFGYIQTVYPYYYEMSDLDSYSLLYTVSGSGTLIIGDCSYTLAPGTIALIHCKETHRITIQQSPWNYKVFFMNGKLIPFLYHSIVSDYQGLHTLSLGSDIPNLIQKFFIHLEKKPEKSFVSARFIIDILSEILMEKERLNDANNPIPEYLTTIKNNFDQYYQNNFTLNALEQEYRISKYRICREFSEYFGLSPIQYLNHKRICIAKEELIHTDKRVNEIGRMVGIENTNLFIRLFKKQTGVTPLDYRKQPPANNLF